MFCPICGTKNEDGAVFCAKCGTELPNMAAPARASHLDTNGDGIPDVLEPTTVAAPPTTVMAPPTTVMAPPTTVMAPPTTVLPSQADDLDATRVAPRPATQQRRYQPSPQPAPAPQRKKGGRGIIVALLAIIVLACAAFGIMYWQHYQAQIDAAEQARIEQEEAERRAAEEAAQKEEQRKPHDVILPISAEGLDAYGSRIPVQVKGTDFEGNSFDQSFYVSYDGTGINVRKGSYEVTILASPIASDGTVYAVPSGSFPFTIPDTQETGSVFKAPGSIVLTPLDPLSADDVIAQALAFAQADPDLSADVLSALSDAVNAKKSAASDAKDQAAHDQAVSKAQADGLTVVAGTVHIMTGSELCSFQGYEFEQVFGTGEWANEEAQRIYVVIVFDEETELNCMSADGSGLRTDVATMIAVTKQSKSTWEKYDGKTVTVGFRPEETWWPTDVSLPMGQPRTPNVRIID